LRHRKTNEPAHLNFAFQNKIQRKFSPLRLKTIPSEWQGRTALQLPNFIAHPLIEVFGKVSANNVADFCWKCIGAWDCSTVFGLPAPAIRIFGARRATLRILVDVPYEGEIVRARFIDGGLKLHEAEIHLSRCR